MKKIIARILRKVALSTLPSRYELPIRYYTYILEGEAEKELINLYEFKLKSYNTAIDIGSNYGFYSYRMSKRFKQVHAFEISPKLCSVTDAYHKNNIIIHNLGLSDNEDELTLYTPVSNGMELHGWASLEKRELPFAETFIENKFHVTTLDKFDFINIDLIKIDVEGHELKVLQGGIKTIERHKPLLIIETTNKKVMKILSTIGYRKTTLKELIGVEGSPQNCIFIY